MDFELIDEGHYEQTMRQQVLPALEACKREGWMRSHDSGASSAGAPAGSGLQVSKADGPGPGNLHYVCYEAARFDDLALPGSQGIHRGVVVISHGFTEFAGKYSELAWYFLLSGYSVCILEHWGHGLSGRGVDDPNLVWVDAWQRYVADLAAFCQEVAVDYAGDQPVCLYAHSMGGGIAASLLERHPALVDRVVLSSPMIAPRTGMPAHIARPVIGSLCSMGLEKSKVPVHSRFNQVFNAGSVGNASLARLRWIHGLRAANPAYQTSAATYGWVRQALAMSSNVLKPALCERVEAATLLFQASPDNFVQPNPQNRFLSQIRAGGSDAKMVRIPNATHELYTMPNPVLGPYLSQILDFFAQPDTFTADED